MLRDFMTYVLVTAGAIVLALIIGVIMISYVTHNLYIIGSGVVEQPKTIQEESKPNPDPNVLRP